MKQFITIQQIFFKDKSIEDTCRLEAIKFHPLLLNNQIERWTDFMNEKVIDEGFYFISRDKLFKFTYSNDYCFEVEKVVANNSKHNLFHNIDNSEIYDHIDNDNNIYNFINNINYIHRKELNDNLNNMFIQFYKNIFFIVVDNNITNDKYLFFNNFFNFINNNKYINLN